MRCREVSPGSVVRMKGDESRSYLVTATSPYSVSVNAVVVVRNNLVLHYQIWVRSWWEDITE